MKIINIIILHFLLSFRGLIRWASKLLSLVFVISFLSMISLNELASLTLATKMLTCLFAGTFTFIYYLYDYVIFYFQSNKLDLILKN